MGELADMIARNAGDRLARSSVFSWKTKLKVLPFALVALVLAFSWQLGLVLAAVLGVGLWWARGRARGAREARGRPTL